MSFGAIVAVIFVVLGVLNAVSRAGKGTGAPGGRFPRGAPPRQVPPGQPRAEYTRPGGTTAGTQSAEKLLPDELWAILTGQAPPPRAPTGPTARPRPAAPPRPASSTATVGGPELASGDRAELDWAGEQMAGGRELAEQEEQSLERSAFETPDTAARDEDGLLRIPRPPARGGVPATAVGPGGLAARLNAQELAREAERRAAVAAAQTAPGDVIAATAIGATAAKRSPSADAYGESLRDRAQVRRAMVLQIVLGPPKALE